MKQYNGFIDYSKAVFANKATLASHIGLLVGVEGLRQIINSSFQYNNLNHVDPLVTIMTPIVLVASYIGEYYTDWGKSTLEIYRIQYNKIQLRGSISKDAWKSAGYFMYCAKVGKRLAIKEAIKLGYEIRD